MMIKYYMSGPRGISGGGAPERSQMPPSSSPAAKEAKKISAYVQKYYPEVVTDYNKNLDLLGKKFPQNHRVTTGAIGQHDAEIDEQYQGRVRKQ